MCHTTTARQDKLQESVQKFDYRISFYLPQLCWKPWFPFSSLVDHWRKKIGPSAKNTSRNIWEPGLAWWRFVLPTRVRCRIQRHMWVTVGFYFSTLVKEVFFFESSNGFVVEYPKFLLEPEGHSFDCCSENWVFSDLPRVTSNKRISKFVVSTIRKLTTWKLG